MTGRQQTQPTAEGRYAGRTPSGGIPELNEKVKAVRRDESSARTAPSSAADRVPLETQRSSL